MNFTGLFLGGAFLLIAASILSAQDNAVVDSASAVFRGDSAKAATIRSVEAGQGAKDSTSLERADSLLVKQKRRRPYIGLTASAAFADNSAKGLFSSYMATTAAADSQRIVQGQDPVHLFFPMGLVVGFPVFTYLDIWVRTEHFFSNPIQYLYTFPTRNWGYTISGVAQKNNESPREFSYKVHGHLVGLGARYLVPVSLLSVNGSPGLYAAYTHFWNFGPTGITSPTGSVQAKTEPSGAGYEVQLGVQQDFDKRFAFIGGVAFSRLTFSSDSPWTAVVPTGPDTPAKWTLQSLRISFQAIYQIGK